MRERERKSELALRSACRCAGMPRGTEGPGGLAALLVPGTAVH